MISFIFFIIIVCSIIGLVIPEKNLTCEAKEKHKHPKSNEFGERYIVHNEPSLGYVTLNGVLRKIEDCKDL